ncbi:class I SAM-dependent methyltransferase [Luteipulveratus flavus]|uniref:Methyltransferase domain-containing protein n=1 Tax=Luteipulveratus flavus TaxID=3031728 RepID=A0ABT6CBG9_9MICO|nr:class I SAM-dependent methyltransferase [Luteipulveratus sp. YIM 133296]MDF8266238.1 methyltransferase domain-containing protein [Luteipulveratus sp. YIM 133296]
MTEGSDDSSDQSSFSDGVDPWLRRLGNVRNVVRQEMVARQLASHLEQRARVLDVGAGQGTQAIRLARLGHEVTCVEPDPAMRDAFSDSVAPLAGSVRARLTLHDAALGTLDQVLAGRTFEAVLCHGVLMYLPASEPAVRELASLVTRGGLLSLVTRNAEAIPWRPALRAQWEGSLAGFDELDAAEHDGRDATYVNELGVRARADRLADLVSSIERHGLQLEEWYGVRVASDRFPVDEPLPPQVELAALLDVEERLGRRDPYRGLGTLMHLIGRRPTFDGA